MINGIYHRDAWMEGFEAFRPNAFYPSWYCLNRVPQLVVSAIADNPLPALYAGPFPPLGGHCLLSYETVTDDWHYPSRAGYRWPTMEPSVKRFSVSLIRREPRSSEARWRKADWNGEAENRSEATLRRQAVPRPAADKQRSAPTPNAAKCRQAFGNHLPAGRPHQKSAVPKHSAFPLFNYFG
jgi:hypothetical protein